MRNGEWGIAVASAAGVRKQEPGGGRLKLSFFATFECFCEELTMFEQKDAKDAKALDWATRMGPVHVVLGPIPSSASVALPKNLFVGGVSRADSEPQHNRLWGAIRNRGRRPLPQSSCAKPAFAAAPNWSPRRASSATRSAMPLPALWEGRGCARPSP